MSRNVAPMWVVPLIIAFAIAGLALVTGQVWGLVEAVSLDLRRRRIREL